MWTRSSSLGFPSVPAIRCTDTTFTSGFAPFGGHKALDSESDTHETLRNAAKYRDAKKYQDYFIVDLDTHHYEGASWTEIIDFIEDYLRARADELTDQRRDVGVGRGVADLLVQLNTLVTGGERRDVDLQPAIQQFRLHADFKAFGLFRPELRSRQQRLEMGPRQSTRSEPARQVFGENRSRFAQDGRVLDDVGQLARAVANEGLVDTAGHLSQDARGQGGSAVATAVKIIKKEPFEKEVFIPFQLVTRENVDQFLK